MLPGILARWLLPLKAELPRSGDSWRARAFRSLPQLRYPAPSDSAQNWSLCYIPSMTRTEAIAKITATLPQLSDERVQTLAEIAQGWTDDAARPAEDDATRAAIDNVITQGRRGEFANDAEIAKAYARFRE